MDPLAQRLRESLGVVVGGVAAVVADDVVNTRGCCRWSVLFSSSVGGFSHRFKS